MSSAIAPSGAPTVDSKEHPAGGAARGGRIGRPDALPASGAQAEPATDTAYLSGAAIRPARRGGRAGRGRGGARHVPRRGGRGPGPPREAGRRDGRPDQCGESLPHADRADPQIPASARWCTGRGPAPRRRRAKREAGGVQAAGGADGQADADAAGRPGGQSTVQGKPGGRDGHTGHGRPYKPTRTVRHNLPRKDDGTLALQQCRCGKGHWVLVNNEGRAIPDLDLILECIKHVREVAECTGCGRRRPAVDGLPARGAWSRSMWASSQRFGQARWPAGTSPGCSPTPPRPGSRCPSRA